MLNCLAGSAAPLCLSLLASFDWGRRRGRRKEGKRGRVSRKREENEKERMEESISKEAIKEASLEKIIGREREGQRKGDRGRGTG